MSLTLRNIADNVNRHLRNAGTRDLANISQADRDDIIKDAIRKYSRVRPINVLQAYTGTVSAFYSLPTQWVSKFSTITEIEYPVENSPKSIIDEKYYRVDLMSDAEKIRFEYENPGQGNTFWVKYTIMHSVDSTGTTTLPDTDFDVITYLGCVLVADALMAFYASKADASLSEVEIVGYNTRVAEFKRVSDKFMGKYESELTDDDPGVYGEVSFLRDTFFDRDQY